MGEDKIYLLHYYNGSNKNTVLDRLSEQYGMLFCQKRSSFKEREEPQEYYDPRKRRYVTTEKKMRKNIMFNFYRYDSEKQQFTELGIYDNTKYSNKFFADNFIDGRKIKDKIHLISRMKKIEKLKKTLM